MSENVNTISITLVAGERKTLPVSQFTSFFLREADHEITVYGEGYGPNPMVQGDRIKDAVVNPSIQSEFDQTIRVTLNSDIRPQPTNVQQTSIQQGDKDELRQIVLNGNAETVLKRALQEADEASAYAHPADVAVGNAAPVEVLAQDDTRLYAFLYNTGSAPIRLGGPGLPANRGGYIPAGASFKAKGPAALYARCAAGQNSTLAIKVGLK